MTVDNILSRLEKVKPTGPGRWLGCCPAHPDTHPSLAIRELEDGRVLLHDFGGCSTSDVLVAMGLAYWDLFPKAADFHLPKVKRPFAPMDILRAVASEALIAATSASNLSKGIVLSDDDRARLWTAATRLQNACEVANG